VAEGIRRRRRVKIVATIGPASSSYERLDELFRAGADVFRLNFSHGTQDDHAGVVERIRKVEKKTGRPIGILADLQGPKLRVGHFAAGHVVLQWGRSLRLDLQATPGDSGRVQLPHQEIMAAAGPGSMLLLDDGKVRLEVTRQTSEYLETLVIVGGENGGRWTGGFGRQLRAAAWSPFLSQRLIMLTAKEHHRFLDRLAESVGAGAVTPALERTYPLEEAADALRRLAEGRVRGKIAVIPRPPR